MTEVLGPLPSRLSNLVGTSSVSAQVVSDKGAHATCLLQRMMGGGSSKGSAGKELMAVRDLLMKKALVFDPDKRAGVDKILRDEIFAS